MREGGDIQLGVLTVDQPSEYEVDESARHTGVERRLRPHPVDGQIRLGEGGGGGFRLREVRVDESARDPLAVDTEPPTGRKRMSPCA